MLHKRKVNTYLIRILYYWYNNQEIKIKLYKIISEPFKVTNGVRQGGRRRVLSPFLFNIYVKVISE